MFLDKEGTYRTSLNVPSSTSIDPFPQTGKDESLAIKIGGDEQGTNEVNLSLKEVMGCGAPESRIHLSECESTSATSALPLEGVVDGVSK